MIMVMDESAARYQPGVCNIGPAEVRRRRLIGYAGLAAAAALGLGLLAIDAAPLTRMLVALPLAAGFDGLVQARLRFCAGYGLAGLRNMGELGEAERVEDAAARSADRRKALIIHGTAVAAGLVTAALFVLVPV